MRIWQAPATHAVRPTSRPIHAGKPCSVGAFTTLVQASDQVSSLVCQANYFVAPVLLAFETLCKPTADEFVHQLAGCALTIDIVINLPLLEARCTLNELSIQRAKYSSCVVSP